MHLLSCDDNISRRVGCACEKCRWENTWIAIRGGAECEVQDALTPQLLSAQPRDNDWKAKALQDTFFMQPAVFVGLIAHLTRLTLQDDIATTARRLQQLGRTFSRVHPFPKEASRVHKRLISVNSARVPPQFSWVDQRLVRERVIDHLSHEACALYLFLVTVADAQGLSFYADRSLCQRLSMAAAGPAPGAPGPHPAGLGGLSTPSLPGLSLLGREVSEREPARSSTDDGSSGHQGRVQTHLGGVVMIEQWNWWVRCQMYSSPVQRQP